MRFVSFYLAILLAFMAYPATDSMAADTVYRWVDEDGNVHFSDQPPGKTDAEVVNINPSTGVGVKASTEDTLPSTADQPSRAQQLRDERAEKREANATMQAATDAECAKHKQRISQLEPSTRVMVTNLETGEVTRMDDNDRLTKLTESKDFVSQNCNK